MKVYFITVWIRVITTMMGGKCFKKELQMRLRDCHIYESNCAESCNVLCIFISLISLDILIVSSLVANHINLANNSLL